MPREEPYNTDRARHLRAEQSPPEGVLWSKLRDRRLGGFKFRRQHPIGPIVVDFCCTEAMLVVELDSTFHNGKQVQDAERDRLVAERGYDTMRITSRDLAMNEFGVLQTILQRATERMKGISPSPGLSSTNHTLPGGEREQVTNA